MRGGGIAPLQGRCCDHWRSYLTFTDCQHSFCNGPSGEQRFVGKQYEHAGRRRWNVCMLGRSRIDFTTVTALPPDRLAYYQTQYDALIAQGFADNCPQQRPYVQTDRPTQTVATQKSTRPLAQHRTAGVLAFMYDFRIPFDNNLAERDVRMIKVQQKVSGCSVA